MLNWLSHSGSPWSYLFIYLFIWRASGLGRGRERGRQRESQASSSLSVQSPTRGPNSWTARSWSEPKSRVGCLTDWATRHPWIFFLNNPKAPEHLGCDLLYPGSLRELLKFCCFLIYISRSMTWMIFIKNRAKVGFILSHLLWESKSLLWVTVLVVSSQHQVKICEFENGPLSLVFIPTDLNSPSIVSSRPG